jgi:methylmalonyl-CoA mutase C-terminal domain/subunit
VQRPYRVVVAKPGLDGHDRGAKTISRALRDHGFEVIYTGLHQTPEQIAETTMQEDADAVGLSLLSGAHSTLFPRVMAELKERGLDDVLVFGGGVIPTADVAALKELGVAEVFTPGSSLSAICRWLESALDAREGGEPAPSANGEQPDRAEGAS